MGRPYLYASEQHFSGATDTRYRGRQFVFLTQLVSSSATRAMKLAGLHRGRVVMYLDSGTEVISMFCYCICGIVTTVYPPRPRYCATRSVQSALSSHPRASAPSEGQTPVEHSHHGSTMHLAGTAILQQPHRGKPLLCLPTPSLQHPKP